MRIDRKLNLVLTLDRDSGPAYVHCAPLPQAVVDAYFMTLSKTYSAMEENGGPWMIRMGPRFAALTLRRVAEEEGTWAGDAGVENGLINEMRRLCNVLLPASGGAGGWEMVPLADASGKGMITPEDAREVDNALTFFMVGCACLRPREADTQMSLVFGMWGAQVTSFSCTEYLSSLPTSTPAASTGERETLSSIPS